MAKSKTKYVDGFVFVVPKKNIPAYIKMARMAEKVWKKYGALDYKECQGDALHPKGMGGAKSLLFPKLVKLKAGETVWFSYITYKSKAHRDQVNTKVMKHFSALYPDASHKDMPFDVRRMSYGGFTVKV